jgi:UDP-4-amino-4,6-dideoxy-N-acetyl-beta-L-altrosamine transaminase
MIPYGRQDISQADIDAVVEVLRSDFLTQGPAVPRLEAAVAAYCGAAHAVAVNSATSALHIACLALGLGPGDWLWTSPNTFVASANCGLYCGTQVDFVDIDPRTYNLSVEALAAKLAQAEGEGRVPKVVVPVHFAGQACDMRAIRALADRYGFRVIEDASHAIGGRFLGEPIGSGRWSDITVFSFHPVKIVTTGEGGMAVTNDPDLAATMARLRTHGITRESALMRGESHGPWYYQQIELGFNYRMTDIQAALGASQMTRLEGFVARRRELAARYDAALADVPVIRPWQHPDTLSAWHLYVIQVDPLRTSIARGTLFDRLRAADIGVNVHYIPVHTQPYYAQLGFAPGHCPAAERYYANAISLPLYSAMTEAQQSAVLDAVRGALT